MVLSSTLLVLALIFQGVESQAGTRCYLQNRCTQTIPGGNMGSVADCCTEERLSMVDGRTCGNRGDPNCSVYFRRPQFPGECQACVFIGFQNDSFILRENDAQAMLRVELLSFGTIDGFLVITPAIDQALTNATENEDYSLPTSQQLFYTGTIVPNNPNINIDIRNDNVALEPVEVIKLNLGLSSTLPIGHHSTTIIIEDNDELFINVVSAAFIRVMEGSASAVSLNITKDKRTAVDVGIKVTPLTYQQYSNKAATDATLPSLSNIRTPSDPAEEQDFNNTAVQLSLGKESSSVIVNMEGLVNDDNIFEESEGEGFILLIELINPDPRVRLNNSVIAIEIVSDEKLILTFDQSLLQLNENSGAASINIVPFNGTISELETPITLPYESQPSLKGDATVSPATSVAFNGTRATLLVTPVKDNILEDIVNSTITFSTGNRTDIEFRPTNSVNVIIIDDENVTLRLSADSTVVTEGSSFNVCVSIAEPSDIGSFIIPIALTLIPYPPTQEEDYGTNSNLLLTLDQSNRSTCFLIRTNEDEITEENERFGIRMELQDSPQTEVYRSRTKYDPQVLNMTVNNDDRVRIGFLMRAVTVEEGSNPVSICFTVKEGTLARSVNVNVSSSSNTAAIGIDYNFTSSVYTFNSNINEQCASFVPIDDDIIEAPEVVAIQLSSNDPAVTFDIDTENVTIMDSNWLPSVQDYHSVECYTSISNCNGQKNGITLTAIDCCGQGYIRHYSLNGTDQQCGACFVVGFKQPSVHFVSNDVGRVTSLTADVLLTAPGAPSLGNNVFFNIKTGTLPNNIDDFFVSLVRHTTVSSSKLPYNVRLEIAQGNAVALQPSIEFNYVFSLNSKSRLPPGVVLVFKNATISAEDIDIMSIGLKVCSSIVEGLTVQPRIKRKEIEFLSPFEVIITLESPLRKDFGDFNFLMRQSIIFEPNQDRLIIEKSMSFMVREDNIVELLKPFVVKMSVNDSRIIFTSAPAYPLVVDSNNVFNVGFRDTEVSINEGEKANLIIQQIGNEVGGEDIGGFPEGQLVPLTFDARTAFETFRADITFNYSVPRFSYRPNNTLDDITFSPVTSLQDNFIEGNKTIKLVLLPGPNSEKIRIIQPLQTATITIIDSTTGELSLERGTYNVIENEGSVEICAVLTGGVLSSDTDIDLKVSPNTARSGSDYSVVDGQYIYLTLPRNTSRICTRINIINDTVLEDLYEKFAVKIGRIFPDVTTLRVNTDPSMVWIQDDD